MSCSGQGHTMKTLLLVLDLVGTFVFALSGASAGVRRLMCSAFWSCRRGGEFRRHYPGPDDRSGSSGRNQRLALCGGFAAGRHYFFLLVFRHRPAAQLRPGVLRCRSRAVRRFRYAKGARLWPQSRHGGPARDADRDRRGHGPRRPHRRATVLRADLYAIAALLERPWWWIGRTPISPRSRRRSWGQRCVSAFASWQSTAPGISPLPVPNAIQVPRVALTSNMVSVRRLRTCCGDKAMCKICQSRVAIRKSNDLITSSAVIAR